MRHSPEDTIGASGRFFDRATGSERAPARAGARLLLAAVTISLVLGGITPAAAQPTDQERMRRAVDYLLAAQLPSGLFVYDFDFVADQIGRASCRERVEISVGIVPLQKKLVHY